MGVDVFAVAQPGMLTTVQDMGRLGYQRLGVPVAGAVDSYAFRVGNLLVGNNEGEAGLEITMMGPTLNVLSNAIIAVTGADLGATLNGKPLPLWESVPASKGDVIAFQGPVSGLRAYLCVAGGIDVPLVMGSRSTYLPGKIGGYQGRALRQGDVLQVAPSKGEPPVGFRLPRELVPRYGGAIVLRVVLGPQDDQFTQEGTKAFLSTEYTVTPQMDRMGVRLEGPPIAHASKADIVSDGIMLGSIQVPGSQQPIVMMADRQTTGGYTKIATIISVDMPRLAQAQPGDKVRFASVTVDEAHAAFRELDRALEQAFARPEAGEGYMAVEHQGKQYRVNLKDDVYELLVSDRPRQFPPKRYIIAVDGTPYDVTVR